MVNEGVRRAYSILIIFACFDTERSGRKTHQYQDNTPAVVHMEVVTGDTVEVDIAAKGGGSEAKAKFVMLNPSDSMLTGYKNRTDYGAGWCPPGILGIV